MIQTKKLLAVVSVTLLIIGSKLLLFTGCSPRQEVKIDEKEFIAREYYQCDCLSKEQTYKDSLENIRQLLTPGRTFKDTLNNVSINAYAGTLEYCNTILFMVFNKNNKRYFVPFCDEWPIQKDKRDTSLVNENTLFAKKLKEFIKKEQLKYPDIFVQNIFDSVLYAKEVDWDYLFFRTKEDSIFVHELVKSDTNAFFYQTVLASEGIWSIKTRNDSLNISLLNARNIRCYNH